MTRRRDPLPWFGLWGGHRSHGDLALDQLFTMRPLLGWARYRTPIAGLLLRGSETSPGSDLNGISGTNTVLAITEDPRR